MSTLHILNKGLLQAALLDRLLLTASSGDHLMLTEDAVIWACSTELGSRLQQAGLELTVSALQPDLQARGLESRILPDIACVEDAAFVQAVCTCQRVLSWF
ncbi:MAG: sulfurtransferase complex subunit TusB [Hahellaceae bacterium]|jgi:tRNA 2-thiouridine synthesizing protein B|nr:sulfurtransferase complex subunit TusB [Hahellaceae bacterium]